MTEKERAFLDALAGALEAWDNLLQVATAYASQKELEIEARECKAPKAAPAEEIKTPGKTTRKTRTKKTTEAAKEAADEKVESVDDPLGFGDDAGDAPTAAKTAEGKTITRKTAKKAPAKKAPAKKAPAKKAEEPDGQERWEVLKERAQAWARRDGHKKLLARQAMAKDKLIEIGANIFAELDEAGLDAIEEWLDKVEAS